MFRKVTKEQLQVPAHIDYLAELREFISEVGKKHKLSESMIKSFKLAIDEAATNIIRHAYRDVEDEDTITLRIIVRKESVTVCVIDRGKRFDPRNVKEPDLNRYVEIGKRGGLGIFIIRKLMDDIEYRTTAEGNELRLTKNREVKAQSRISRWMPAGFKAMSLGMKTRFWAKTCLFMVFVVAVFVGVSFVQIAETVLKQQIPTWNIVASQIAKTLEEDKTILEDLTGGRANQLLNSLISKRKDEIIEAALVDSAGQLHGDSELGKTFTQYDFAPFGDEKQVDPFLYQYHIAADSSGSRTAIYDYFPPVEIVHPNHGKMNLHLRVQKAYLDEMIAAERWRVFENALFVLGIGCIGSFLLIYLLLNPMRKLADFVRSGGEAAISDDIEIDPSSDIGEIAKAFSDITAKFRESQRNLAEQERLQQEMQVAKEIQQTLLPNEFPDLEGYEIAGHYESAELVGGDYYDFVEVDRDTLGIVVADVSGKGVPGSMVMTMIRQALRTESRGVKNAAEVLSRLNDLVVGDMRKGMFVTIFYVIIDSKRRRLNFASAGHNPMILYRGSTQKTYYLNPRGFPIGIELPDKNLFRESIESDTIQLVEGDLVLLYTDGITEAMDEKRDLYGEERLLDALRHHGAMRAQPFTEKLSSLIQSFTGGFPQSDDITFVAVREKTTLQKEELRRAKQAYTLISEGNSIRSACEIAGISTFAYYNKYKRTFEEEGIESFELDKNDSLEARHIAIEDKAKIFDIIRNHPEYGAKRISDELNSEKYGMTDIPENKIYDELVRSRLNTRQLREAFVARGASQKRRRAFKTPGTPMLTLDGRVIKKGDQLPPTSEFAAPRFDDTSDRPRSKPRIIGQAPSERHSDEPTQAIDIFADKPFEQEPRLEEHTEDETQAMPVQDRDLDAGEPKETVEPLTGDETVEQERPDFEETDDDFELIAEAPKEGEETSKSLFAVEDLLKEEITRTFASAEETDDGSDRQDAEDEADHETDEVAIDEKTDVFIAGIDELLNEDALDTTTVSIDGEIDVQSEVDAVFKAASTEADREKIHETETRGSADKSKSGSKSDNQSTDMIRSKKSLLFREQKMTVGYRFYKAQKYDEAIQEFENVVAEFPAYKKAYKILANAYFRTGRYEDAIRTYQAVKAKDPDDVAAYENLGIAYIKTGEVENALKQWQELLQLAPYRQDIQEKLDLLVIKVEQSSER